MTLGRARRVLIGPIDNGQRGADSGSIVPAAPLVPKKRFISLMTLEASLQAQKATRLRSGEQSLFPGRFWRTLVLLRALGRVDLGGLFFPEPRRRTPIEVAHAVCTQWIEQGYTVV
jgi:hypothetical protein